MPCFSAVRIEWAKTRARSMRWREEVEDSGEEDEAIPTLPPRPIKATYVDEVLVM